MSCAICSDPPFVFVHIPKTGGTSFMSRRAKTGQKLNLEGLTIFGGHVSMTTIASKRDVSKHFKFTIVRNPFDRFVSLWFTKYNGRPMGDFINDIDSGKLSWYPLWPQVHWITNGRNNLLVDYIIKYESYIEGITDVLTTLGLKIFSIPHLRKTDRFHDYRLYYKKDEHIRFVRKLYKDDLRILGYTY